MSLLQSISNARKTLNGFTDENLDNLTVESKVKLSGSETGINVAAANHTADLTKTFTLIGTTHGTTVREVHLPYGGADDGLIHYVSNGDSSGASLNVKPLDSAGSATAFLGGGTALALAVGGACGSFVWNVELDKWVIIGELD